MGSRARLALVVLVCVLLSGCTVWPLDAGDGAAADAASSSLQPGEAARDDPVVPRVLHEPSLRLGVDVVPAWVKPRNLVEMSAVPLDAPREALPLDVAWHWFVGTNGSDVRVRNASGVFYLQGGTGEGTGTRREPSGAAGLDTGLVPPGAASLTIEFPQPARYSFGVPRHPGAAFDLTVLPEAAVVEDLEVLLVGSGSAFRFAPEAAHVGPGSRVHFVNRDVAAHAVLEERYWAHVPWGAPALLAVGVDTGWYEVLALATTPDVDAPGGLRVQGEAYGALLLDFLSPPLRAQAGPFSGRLIATSDAEASSFPLTAAREVRLLELDVALGTPAGATDAAAPPTLEVILRRAAAGDAQAEEVARFELDESARIPLERLPAGAYRVEVRLLEGAVADFKVEAFLRYDVQPPPLPGWMHADAAVD